MEFILSFIVIAVLVFYLFGILGRALLGYWIRKKQQEFAQNGGPFFQWRSGGNPRNNGNRPEGDIIVEQTQVHPRKVKGGVGDYVDFEEVKENAE